MNVHILVDGVVCKIMVFCDHLSYTKNLLTMLKTIKNNTSKGNTMYLVWGSLSSLVLDRKVVNCTSFHTCHPYQRSACHEHKVTLAGVAWAPSKLCGDVTLSHQGPRGPWSWEKADADTPPADSQPGTACFPQPSIQNVMWIVACVRDGASPTCLHFLYTE